MRAVLVFCMIFVGVPLSAQINIFDSFDDNTNRWPLTVGADGSMKIENGRYEVASTNEGFWQYTHQLDSGLSTHFRIEASVERSAKTAPGKSCGIIWGTKSDTTRLAFLIYGDGSFVFQHLSDGLSKLIIPVTKHAAIRVSGYNHMRVERNVLANEYEFFVNEQLVGHAAFIAPASSEFGLYADMVGTFHFDNFWFVKDGNTDNDYQPQKLVAGGACSLEQLNYTSSDWGYSFCVPAGWRVDTYKETRVSIWQVGSNARSNVIVADFSNLAIEDSFRVAAEGDFRILIDSAHHATEKQKFPLVKILASNGSEAWHARATYTSREDQTRYSIDRYYVFNSATGAFLLFQLLVPSLETKLIESYRTATEAMIKTIVWPAKQ